MSPRDSSRSIAEQGVAQVSMAVVDRAAGRPALHSGVATELSVTLTNAGATIPLDTGAPASTLTLYLPEYIPTSTLATMSIDLDHWTFQVSSAQDALILTYAGSGAGGWRGDLAFTITGVEADGSPTYGTFQANFTHMAGAPAQLTTPLPLVNAPRPGNASLAEVLQVSLDNQGSVFVSTALDPLSNTLFLNIKNTGATPLYTGNGSPSGALITVSCAYGDTSGALAPAASTKPTTPPLGSAWSIEGGIYVDQTEGWRVLPAQPRDRQPTWRLAPETGNTNLIGTGSKSNVTFCFSDIVSLTAVGHTQMTLTFSGFKKDDNTDYDTLVLTLDIVKQVAPPTRGLLSFFGSEPPVIHVPNEKTPVDIPLRWSMAQVNQVQLFTSFPGVGPVQKRYALPPATPAPLAYDEMLIQIPPTTQSGLVSTTLQAMDAQGVYLNALQYSFYLQLMVFVDPRDNQSYPITLLNNKYWMTRNLKCDETGSHPYNDMESNAEVYGRLYSASSDSAVSPPAGWRVPSERDWNDLIACYGDATKAYHALTGTGAGQLAAQLGGKYVPSATIAQFTDLTVKGYYQAVNGASPTFVTVDSTSSKVVVGGSLPAGACLSIRYVKDL